MKKINIKGKEYIEVNERLKHFRENYKGYSLESEVLEKTDSSIMIKAIIKDAESKIIATGLAEEIKGSTFINKTSYVENCETSAWGRALGNLGIGIETSIASYEEVKNAIDNSKKSEAANVKSKPKKKLTMDEVKKASEMINKGQYKKEYFAENYALTANQKKILEIC